MRGVRPLVATFSIVAFDPATASWGVAVQSRVLACGGVVAWARAGAGAVATQAMANAGWGPHGLALLEAGHGADEVVHALVTADGSRDVRQLGVVYRLGRAAAFTGVECIPESAHVVGRGFACQGNMLASREVVAAMARAFEHDAGGPFPERLVAALVAGQVAGGDRRGQQSAGLLVVREGGGVFHGSDRAIDLRVDDHAAPIDELVRLLALHRATFG
jgi:uncharacterized Ntn-hydrolase superfamily protein